MASRREEKERLRQIREEAEKREASEQRRKLLLGYGSPDYRRSRDRASCGRDRSAVGLRAATAMVSTASGLARQQDLELDEREGTRRRQARWRGDKDQEEGGACVLETRRGEANTPAAARTPEVQVRPIPPAHHARSPRNAVYSSPIRPQQCLHTLEHVGGDRHQPTDEAEGRAQGRRREDFAK